MPEKRKDIWILVEHRDGVQEDTAPGLAGEALRLRRQLKGGGEIRAVAMGRDLPEAFKDLGERGVDRLLFVGHESLGSYHGERHANVLARLVERHRPTFILMAHSPETSDLAPRLAAAVDSTVAVRCVDLQIGEDGLPRVVRPVANGYLFEQLRLMGTPPFVVTFLPSVLSPPEEHGDRSAELAVEALKSPGKGEKTKVIKVVPSDPGSLGLEEADIVVSGGRGVGRGKEFDLIHELAKVLGGSVGGSRPVIDWGTLPFERQIGQTGKRVAPRLIFACGISGANEFTAGMEGAQVVIVVNQDPRARIFRFADLGVVGDLHQILPRLIQRIQKETGEEAGEK